MPVALPPGRARLATRPSLTGSSPTMNTIGIVVVAALAASEPFARCDDHRDAAANEIGHEPAVDRIDCQRVILDREVLAFDIASFVETFAECSQTVGACRAMWR